MVFKAILVTALCLCLCTVQAWWRPAPGTSWQYQLQGKPDLSVDVQVYDFDLYDTPIAVIDSVHAKGRKIVCYFSAGTYEDWRTDAKEFPAESLGSSLPDWPGERWVDHTNSKVRSIMMARLDLAASKGCDAVEPDNMDGYANKNGLGLTFAQQLNYNTFIAAEAHKRGLAVGLKNDLDQVKDLVNDYDFAVNEQCAQYNECTLLLPFIAQNKAVFGVEYKEERSNPNSFCPETNSLNFDFIQKTYDLLPTPFYQCRSYSNPSATPTPTSTPVAATPTPTRTPSRTPSSTPVPPTRTPTRTPQPVNMPTNLRVSVSGTTITIHFTEVPGSVWNYVYLSGPGKGALYLGGCGGGCAVSLPNHPSGTHNAIVISFVSNAWSQWSEYAVFTVQAYN